MRNPRRLAVAAALLLATGGLAVSTAGPAAAASCSGVKGDVNGDGLAEVAVGEPGNHMGAGSVHVFYGHATGLVTDKLGTALDDQYFTKATAGVPGTEEPDTSFGRSTVFGDFNGDRCADLAVGSGDDITILYGSTRGIVTTGAQRLVPHDLLGSTAKIKPRGVWDLEVADLDDDGVDDLALGAGNTQVNGGYGAVVIMFGDPSGLNKGATKAEMVNRDTPGVPGKADDSFDAFGGDLTSGDFNGNGKAELAVFTGDASVQTLERGAKGWGNTQPAPIGPSMAGFSTDPSWKYYPWVLAAGDVNGDGRSDLALGDPNYGCQVCESDEEGEGEGAVLILFGAPKGLTLTGQQLWQQDSPGMDDPTDDDSIFGSELAMGHLDDGPTDDLAIGSPLVYSVRPTLGGSVTVLLGSPNGLTTAGLGGARVQQNTKGVGGADESGDHFGGSLTIAAVQSRQRGNLIIGVPYEAIGKVESAGAITQLAATAAGPSGIGSRTYNAGSKGVKGKIGTYERLGESVG